MGVTLHHNDEDNHHRPFLSLYNYGDNISSFTVADNNTAFKSSGMTGEVFTSDQWKELERQAMIYKYIKESIPVPSHLLLPSTGDHGSILNLNFYSPKNGNFSEPERCKRTDGKKWRCSRDVAPHQKYCERHLHRGRPRSRKPVENQTNNNTNVVSKRSRFEQKLLFSNTNTTLVETPPYLFHPDTSISSQREFTRYLDWAMEEQLHHSLGRNIGLETQQGYISYTIPSYFDFQDYQNITPLSNFENYAYKFCEYQQSQMENSSVFSEGNLSPSSLSLSLGTAPGKDEMGLQIEDTNYDSPQISSLCSPISWMGSSTPGGPLAEVLWGSAITEVELN